MPAPVVDLCDAIAQFIGNKTYSFKFNVKRVNYVPRSDLKDTRVTNVFVYPTQPLGSSTDVTFTRGHASRRYTITVHLTNYVDNTKEQVEIDQALLLAHEIEQSLENESFGEFQMVAFESQASPRPFFEIEAQVERNFFHVMINIDYEGVV